MTTTLHLQSLSQLGAALRAKDVSAVEVAQHFLGRAQADTSGAFLAFNEDVTLSQARAADAQLAAGTGGVLTEIGRASCRERVFDDV